MAQKKFRAIAQTLIFWGFEPWLKPTFDMKILTSIYLIYALLNPILLSVCQNSRRQEGVQMQTKKS